MGLNATLALEDGAVFYGSAFGARRDGYGEVCFNTSMTGYQEALTDPSYAGQILAMTCPHIGNVGVNPLDMESRRVWPGGFVVRELADRPSNFRSRQSLDHFLRRSNVPGIAGVDTRSLTKHLRDFGAKRGALLMGRLPRFQAVRRARRAPPYDGVDWVRRVTTSKSYRWNEGLRSGVPGAEPPELGLVDKGLKSRQPAGGGRRHRCFRVAVIDCGIKFNILRNLVSRGCEVTVFPATAKASEILASHPEGVFLSNGPGDPNAVPYVVETLRALLRRRMPIFGICLGHQMLTLALGGKLAKLKFGHRDSNQPVRDQSTRKVEITSHNHGFATVPGSLKDKDVMTRYVGLNDGVVEGLAHRKLPVFSVQYHPEASPGPHDANHLFLRFLDLMRSHKSGSACMNPRC